MWDQEYKRKKPGPTVEAPARKKLDIEIPDAKKAVEGIDAALAKKKLGPPPNIHPIELILKWKLGGELTPEEAVIIKAVTHQPLDPDERAWAVEHLCACFGDDE